MRPFKEHIIVAAVLVILGLVGLLMSANHVSAVTPVPPGPIVTIGGPLPLPVSGSASVSGSVSISNPSTDPVLVRTVGPTRVPFNHSELLGFGNANGLCSSFLPGAPAGQKLVITDFSGQMYTSDGADRLVWVSIRSSYLTGGLLASAAARTDGPDEHGGYLGSAGRDAHIEIPGPNGYALCAVALNPNRESVELGVSGYIETP